MVGTALASQPNRADFTHATRSASKNLANMRLQWATAMGKFADQWRKNPDHASPLAISVTLPKAALGGDVRLTGLCVGDTWVSFDAWSAARGAVLPVEDVSLVLQPKSDGFALAGKVSLRIPGHLLLEAKNDGSETYILEFGAGRSEGTFQTESNRVRRRRSAKATVWAVTGDYALAEDFPNAVRSFAGDGFGNYALAAAKIGRAHV